ncbi:MAG: 30S ribosomal protein S17 [Chloroflexi bacterium]|nr:30S ribosomal protein S17 [Chloroflexota bacterium]
MYQGEVISNRMQKTVVVAVSRWQVHPLYKKGIRRTTNIYAHDPQNQCQIGDLVRVIEVRPLSKTKRWLIKEILGRRGMPVMEVEATLEPIVGKEPAVEEERPATAEQSAVGVITDGGEHQAVVEAPPATALSQAETPALALPAEPEEKLPGTEARS